ncbi:hypothetical protein M0Q50_06360 [bacterium]|jgi:hypothetical protein|nr:hypothetical protein [bacterium]
MKAKSVNECLLKDRVIAIEINNVSIEIIEDIKKRLEVFYNIVKLKNAGSNKYSIITVIDPTAGVEDVSDELYDYIENGIIETVNDLTN